jgi:predicted transposase YdaD
MAEHDSGYKLLFSHPRMVEELLRGFVHEPWVADLDFGTLERTGASFTSDDLRERHSDMVWRLLWQGGERGWFYVYLLLEFQSTPDPFMAVRLLGYVALLLAGLVRTGVATPTEGLPAVLPLVLYNGKRSWKAPADLSSLFRAVPPGCGRYLPQLTYLLVDENRLLPEAVSLPGNRVATLFRLEASTPADLPALTAELAALLPPGEEPELRRDFTSWLIHLLRRMRPGVTIPEVGKLEEIAMLEETLTEWMNGATERGRREGRQEGQVEGMRKLLLGLLEKRFETVPLQVRRRVEAIQSAQKLEELAGRVLVAGSFEEMGLG